MPARYRTLLRNRDFALLIGGQAVSRIGDGLQVAALLWLALEIGGTRAVSLTALAGSAPVFAFGLLGGVYADRLDRRRALIATDAIRGVAVLIIPTAAAMGQLHLWHLLVVAALLASFGTLAEPAGTALIPALVERDDLTAANALSGATLQATFWLGPGLLAVILRFAALKDVFTIDAGTFAVAALAAVFIRYRQRQPSTVARRHVVAEAAEGFATVRRDLLLWAPLAVFGFGILFAAGVREVALPVLVRGPLHEGAAVFGLMIGAAGVGELLGNVVIGGFVVRAKGTAACLGWALLGFFRAFLGLIPIWGLGAGLLFCTGGMSALTDVPLVSLLQERTPEAQLGRVLSLWRSLAYAAIAVAAPVVGGLLAVLPVAWVFLLCGFLTCAGGMVGAAVCRRRERREAALAPLSP